VPGADKPQSPFQRFADLARKLTAVPKLEADKQKAKKSRRAGPAPKSA
jgi:hypothetical protein